MLTLLTIVHFSVCVFLIVIVLLQHGKGADMGASFGGGSGKTVFGTEGPLPLLSKITTASAIIFMFTSVTLAYYSANSTKSSVMKSLPVTAPVVNKVEVAPTPVEVPMTDTQPTKKSDEKAAPADQFPGTTAPAAVEPEKSAAKEPAAVVPEKPAVKESKQDKPPVSQSKETAPAPPKGKK